jgi:hypothetical protein
MVARGTGRAHVTIGISNNVVVAKDQAGGHAGRTARTLRVFRRNILTLAIQTEPNTNVLGVELAGLSRMKRSEILAWLQERRDVSKRHEDRLETVGWAILIAVVIGVVADVAIVAHEIGWLHAN